MNLRLSESSQPDLSARQRDVGVCLASVDAGPACASSAGPGPSNARSDAQGTDPSAADVRRILVVDDNRDITDTLVSVLGECGADVRAAYDGEEALRLVASFCPHAALLDIGMPGLSGYDVCRMIRQLPQGKDMVLIAQTGWGREEDVRRAREAGFDHHVVKPTDLDELVRLLGVG